MIGGVTYDETSILHAEVVRFDGATMGWSMAPSLTEPRAGAAVVRLADGRILVAGGQTEFEPYVEDVMVFNHGATTTEIYDPATDRWTPAAEMPDGRFAGAIARLDDGSVLIVAGGARQCVACAPSPWSNDREPAARFLPGSP